MSHVCRVCQKECSTDSALQSHVRSKHPEYLDPDGPLKKKGKPGPPRKYASDAEAYEAQKAHALAASHRKALTGKEIGPIPEVADPARRERCRVSLLEHMRTYHAARFCLPFSPTHLKVIEKAERAILHSGVFALAMPRRSGKSEMCKAAVEWAILHGHRRFVVLVGAEGKLAAALMDSIKAQLETNPLLLADFPEAVYPIRKLGRQPQKARSQLYQGQPTRIEWTVDQITLAHIPGSISAGSTILTVGITASFRGLSITTPEGGTIRPDLVVVDDPQTRESATSRTQCATRESIIKGDILGLAGPTKAIACLLPCTVIAPDDVADRLLNRKLSPVWQGERSKMVESFPTNEARWDEYFRIRNQEYASGGDGKLCRAYYLAHQPEMDEGAVLSWPEGYDASVYASALEFAMCFRNDNPAEFAAEYQNEPLLAEEIAAGSLSVSILKEKSNAIPRGTAPRDAAHLTAGIDVGKDILYWTVSAWREDGGGAVVDYGTFPRQNRPHFTARDARPTLGSAYPNLDDLARIYAGLDALTKQLLGKHWPRADGGSISIGRVLVDAGYKPAEVVRPFCRQSQFAALLTPSKGVGITATGLPMMLWSRKDRKFFNRFTFISRDGLLEFDSNHWKSHVAYGLRTPPAGLGCIYVPAGDNSHFFEHLTSEYTVTATADKQGRKVEEWKEKPNHPDNHWFDSLVLSAVAGVFLGVRYDTRKAAAVAAPAAPGAAPAPPPAPAPQPQKKPKRSLGDLFREKRAEAQGAYPWMN